MFNAYICLKMSVTTFSPDQFPVKLFNEKKISRCTHPWDKTPVGGGFFVDAASCKSAPSLPDRLKKQGYVYEYAKLVNDTIPGTVHSVTGYLFYRLK